MTFVIALVDNDLNFCIKLIAYFYTCRITEALKGHRQRNNYLQCRFKILDKMRNIRSF